MIPTHFPLMIMAELRKLYSRPSTVATLVAAFALGVAAVGLVTWLKGSDASINGKAVSEVLTISGVDVAGYALRARNFFFLPMFLVLAMASSVAGELSDQTLRDALCRPISRASALWARLIAVQSLSALSLLLTLVPALGGGLLVFGMPVAPVAGSAPTPAELLAAPASLPMLVAGYACTIFTDLGWLSLALLASLYLRSVGGVLVGVLFVLGLDTALRGLFWILEKVQISWAHTAAQFTLGNGLDAWSGWSGGWEPGRFVALAVIIAAAQVLALRRFQKMDVL